MVWLNDINQAFLLFPRGDQKMQGQRKAKLELCQGGVIEIIKMFQPSLSCQCSLRFQDVLLTLEREVQDKQYRQRVNYYLNYVELCSIVIKELQDFVQKGFELDEIDKSLAILMLKMFQIHMLLQGYESLIHFEGNSLITARNSLSDKADQLRMESRILKFQLLGIEIGKFSLISVRMRDFGEQVLAECEIYLKRTNFNLSEESFSAMRLKYVYLNVLRLLRRKARQQSNGRKRGNCSEFLQLAQRLILKLYYLSAAGISEENVLKCNENLELNEQNQGSEQPYCNLFLLKKNNGVKILLNYLNEAPYERIVKNQLILQKLASSKMKIIDEE